VSQPTRAHLNPEEEIMLSSKRWLAVASVGSLTLVVSCVDAGPTVPYDAPHGDVIPVDGPELTAKSTIDVAGTWDWRREELLTVPADFAFIFGIEPEGPITHFRCDVEGVITLVQSDDALSGVEVETASSCETRGGQVFAQPGLGLSIPIHEGRVIGRVVKLLIGDPVLPCPIRAVVEEAANGTAVSMRGTGRCIIPGHPKSDAPEGSPLDLDPPPRGTEKIVVWEATRQTS
jgi:hypothetical protein